MIGVLRINNQKVQQDGTLTLHKWAGQPAEYQLSSLVVLRVLMGGAFVEMDQTPLIHEMYWVELYGNEWW